LGQRDPWVKDSPHPSIFNQRGTLTCVSAQDDATVKCWGSNWHGQLGLGDTSRRGDDANGPCPARSTTACFVPAPRVLTLAAAPRVQRWVRTSLRSTWGLGGRPWPSALPWPSAQHWRRSHMRAAGKGTQRVREGGGELQNWAIGPHTK